MGFKNTHLVSLATFFLGLVAALALCLVLHGCGANMRQLSIAALNVQAALANTAAPGVLDVQCQAELASIGHKGHYADGHCVRTDEPRVATESERAALVRVRAQWAEVRSAYEMYATAHDQAVQAADGESLLKMIAAYGELRRVVAPFGVQLPDLGGAQ